MNNQPLSQLLISGFLQPPDGYAGVTKVLDASSDKSFLDNWRKKVGNAEADKIVKESTDIGSSFDNLMFNHLQGIDVSDRTNEMGYHLYKQSLKHLKHIEPIALQFHCYSHKLKMHGYIDCLCFYKGKLTVLDFKNSKKAKLPEYLDGYWKQCTFYSMMLYDMYGIKIEQLVLFIGLRNFPYPQIEIEKPKNYIKECLESYKVYKGKSNG